MPLLNTNAVLEELGMLPKRRGKEAVNEILSENGLSLEESIVELKSVLDNTTDQHLKAKILDLILSVHGVKEKKETTVIPSITFIFPPSASQPSFLLSNSNSNSETSLRSNSETIDVEFSNASKEEKETQKDALLHLSDRSFK